MFTVGMKVVCVDASEQVAQFRKLMPLVEGHVYEIAEFAAHPARPDEPGVRLKGVERIYLGFDFPFATSRFRPAVSRKTNIDVFTSMLTPSPVTVDAMNLADVAREIVE